MQQEICIFSERMSSVRKSIGICHGLFFWGGASLCFEVWLIGHFCWLTDAQLIKLLMFIDLHCIPWGSLNLIHLPFWGCHRSQYYSIIVPLKKKAISTAGKKYTLTILPNINNSRCPIFLQLCLYIEPLLYTTTGIIIEKKIISTILLYGYIRLDMLFNKIYVMT